MLPRLILRPSFINNALCRVVTSELMIVREKGGKGSPSQSQGRRRPRDHRDYRVKFAPGSWVREKVILATQGKLDYHPGLNVSNIERCFFIVLIQFIFICRLQSILGTFQFTPSEAELWSSRQKKSAPTLIMIWLRSSILIEKDRTSIRDLST